MTVGPAGVALLVVLSYWELVVPGARHVWFDHYDMCQLEIPRLQFLARSLHAGALPLWNPHTWLGQPVLGVGQPGPVYPLNLAFLALPLSNGALRAEVLNWWFVAIHVACAWAMYAFCRDQRLSRSASALGGIVFSASGYVGSLPWLDIENGASLTPLVLLFAFRLWQGTATRRNAAFLGGAIGLSWLSGHHEIPLLTTYAVILGSVPACCWRFSKDHRAAIRITALVGVSLVVAVLISAVQTLPMYEFGRLAERWVGTEAPLRWHQAVPYSVHERYSLPWRTLFGFIAPAVSPESLYLGIAAAVLAGIGLRCLWQQAWVRWTAAIGGCALLYMLGANTPFHRILYSTLPMLDKARTPVRGAVLASFAVAALAAAGAHVLLNRRAPVRFSLSLLSIFVLAALGIHLWAAVPAIQGEGPIHIAVTGVLLAVLVTWRPPGAAWEAFALAVLVGLSGADMAIVKSLRVTRLDEHSVCAANLTGHAELVQKIREQPRLGRITVNSDELMTNLGELHGLYQLQGFVAAAPANILRHELHTQRTQQLAGVTHHVGRTPSAPTDELVASFPAQIGLYRKADPLPQAWITHQVLRVHSDDELRRAIQNPALPLQHTALIQGDHPPQVEQCSALEPVGVARPDSDTVILNATPGCRGLLILSDAFYPGWRASVNGKTVPIHEVDGAFRGVVVESGPNTVVMRYQPGTVWEGVILTCLGLMGFVVLVRPGLAMQAPPICAEPRRSTIEAKQPPARPKS